MPIRSHPSNQSAFDPEAITAMSTAFELACADLKILADDHSARETIATRIVDLARHGVIDAAALHQGVIADERTSA